MKYATIVQSEFVKEARKWNELSRKEQQAYLKAHPKSKKRLTAGPKIGDPGEKRPKYGPDSVEAEKAREKHISELQFAAKLKKIISDSKSDIEKFQKTGELSDELYENLFDYFTMETKEMPYGTAKARTGDPYEWISDKLNETLKTKGSIQ